MSLNDGSKEVEDGESLIYFCTAEHCGRHRVDSVMCAVRGLCAVTYLPL